MYVTGARGVGKTVMLNALGDLARQRKWQVIDETAESKFMQRLIETLRQSPRRGIGSVTLHSASMSVAGTPVDAQVNLGSVEFEAAEHALNFRMAMTERLDKLEKKNRGILITLDEVQASSLPEMRSLATAVQHLIRERRNVAFVFAGLPSMVEDVINVMTCSPSCAGRSAGIWATCRLPKCARRSRRRLRKTASTPMPILWIPLHRRPTAIRS